MVMSLPKVLCPLVCLAASSGARRLTGEPHPVGPHWFGVILVLFFRSHWLSWGITCSTGQFACVISLVTGLCPSAFICITWKGGIRVIREIAFHLDLLMGGRLIWIWRSLCCSACCLLVGDFWSQRLGHTCRKETMLLTCKMLSQIFILWSILVFNNNNIK